jgi:hypothetical protein
MSFHTALFNKISFAFIVDNGTIKRNFDFQIIM